MFLKLDGVGPVVIRPSTNKLHHFVWKKVTFDMWHVTCDMSHMTFDTWHVICDMLGGGGWTFSQNFSCLALTVCDVYHTAVLPSFWPLILGLQWPSTWTFSPVSATCHCAPVSQSAGCQSDRLPVCQSISLPVYHYASLTVNQSASLSVCQSTTLPICQSTSLPVCQSANL